LETPQESKKTHLSTFLIAAILIVSLSTTALLGYLVGQLTIQRKIDDLQDQLSTMPYQNNTYVFSENFSLSQLYEQVKGSVVVIRGLIVQYDFFSRPYYSQVQGSGFICNFTEEKIIVTNYHVVQDAINITTTLLNGNGYATRVLGSDPYEDLAVLTTDEPISEGEPLRIANSSTLEVGDPVIALGNPYGLAGSMTTGIVSALGRTITEDMTNGYPIASVIQTSAPINSGNSGGPLLNYKGEVVGITTAIVSDSQGLGFATPSNAILREIESLVTEGQYDQHPWLGVTGTDMTYEIAEAMGTNVTYGWLIVTGSSDTGLRGGTSRVQVVGSVITVGGDIIIAVNETRITNLDSLSNYLEEYTLPGQTVNLTIVRNKETMILSVELGKRPSPSAIQ
jgi:S1-C subfamily serine protease